jgi:hypothetical protein
MAICSRTPSPSKLLGMKTSQLILLYYIGHFFTLLCLIPRVLPGVDSQTPTRIHLLASSQSVEKPSMSSFCLIRESIEEVMPIITFAVPGATPRPLLFQGVVPGQRPLKLAYLLAHTSKWGVLEHSRILTPWATHNLWPYPSWLLVRVGGRHSQRPGPSPILGSLGPSHHWRHKS